MDIYALPGTLVGFTDGPNKCKIYTVASTKVHPWSTDVFLVELPGRCFNSVNLKEIKADSRLELLIKYGIHITEEEWQKIKDENLRDKAV